MATNVTTGDEAVPEDLQEALKDIEYAGRKHEPRTAMIIGFIAALWSFYQMWIASPLPFIVNFGIITDVPARALHLAFGLLLVYLIFPGSRKAATTGRIPKRDLALAVIGCFSALYLFLAWDDMARRPGVLLAFDFSLFGYSFEFPFEVVLGWCGIFLLLEATRRSIGWPLVIVASVFIIYSVFGQSMPDLISHRGVSPSRLAGYQWLTGEAIFGIPIDVTTSFVFLFVLFGAILDKAGAGQYFLNLAFAMVGRYRGGPVKAAILASGMTGLISGSSVANVVTTGTFTIPVMKRTGMPAVKAGAIEVAASVNGQIMPPIMGAAAFIIAEFIGVTYFEVVKAAFIPAFIIYIALLYISHLEAMKLGLKGLPREEIPPFVPTLLSGLHFIFPIFVLIWLLMVEKWTPSSSVFYSIILMMGIIVLQKVIRALRTGGDTVAGGAMAGLRDVYEGMIGGARNMITIAVAVAAAGIIVGSVSSTGLNNALIAVVEAVSGGNVYILLGMTALLCLLLGMGLPTTANYLVVASLLANVVVELGAAAGLVLPLIAVHLYVFYFGLMADVTPPVALAAFAASAISRADPIKTGVQAFYYNIRTAIIPLVFLFNPELLLIGVESVWHGLMVFAMSLLAILAFSAVSQNWMLVRNRWYENLLLLVAMAVLFRPGYFMDQIHPPFVEFDADRFISGEAAAEPGFDVRFHIIRETNYGDRFKLYRLPTAETAGPMGPYGLRLEKEGDRYRVADMAMAGPAERIGIQFGDYVTAVDVEMKDLPSKHLMYPVALVILGLVIALQFLRWRRGRRQEAADAAASA
ncbi:MAG: TRAP transporter permease [Rhodospirillales bacterium]|jgi:TRAP transporter 4TM/12TM fusion protein|nr:TRAP transporter permease [Rhodospirillales bacterium]